MKMQFGRSMLEMLAVLAIVGILSVAGVIGIPALMDTHRANQIIKEAFSQGTFLALKRLPLGEVFKTYTSSLSHTTHRFCYNSLVQVTVDDVKQSVCEKVLTRTSDAHQILACVRVGNAGGVPCEGAINCAPGLNNIVFTFYGNACTGKNEEPGPDPEPGEACEDYCTGECCNNVCYTTLCDGNYMTGFRNNNSCLCECEDGYSYQDGSCIPSIPVECQGLTDIALTCCVTPSDAVCQCPDGCGECLVCLNGACVPDMSDPACRPCSDGREKCGGECCSASSTCVSSACCPTTQVCGNLCCAAGEGCVNGSCCPAAQVCGDSCCAAGVACVNGKCGCQSTADCGCPENPCLECVAGECKMSGSLVDTGSGLFCCKPPRKGFFAQFHTGGCDDICFTEHPNTRTICGVEYGIGNSCCSSNLDPDVGLGTCGPFCIAGETGVPAIDEDGQLSCCGVGYYVCPVKGMKAAGPGKMATMCCSNLDEPYYNINSASKKCCPDGRNAPSPANNVLAVAGGPPNSMHCCPRSNKPYWTGNYADCCNTEKNTLGTISYGSTEKYMCCPYYNPETGSIDSNVDLNTKASVPYWRTETTGGCCYGSVVDVLGAPADNFVAQKTCCDRKTYGDNPTAYWNGSRSYCCSGTVYKNKSGNYACCNDFQSMYGTVLKQQVFDVMGTDYQMCCSMEIEECVGPDPVSAVCTAKSKGVTGAYLNGSNNTCCVGVIQQDKTEASGYTCCPANKPQLTYAEFVSNGVQKVNSVCCRDGQSAISIKGESDAQCCSYQVTQSNWSPTLCCNAGDSAVAWWEPDILPRLCCPAGNRLCGSGDTKRCCTPCCPGEDGCDNFKCDEDAGGYGSLHDRL